MKKVVLLAMAAVLLASVPAVSGPISREGDPAIWTNFATTPYQLIPGQTWAKAFTLVNAGHMSTLCPQAVGEVDTFCFDAFDQQGWDITNDWEGYCVEQMAGYGYGAVVTLTVPCTATPGMVDTLTITHAYCDVYEVCQPDSADCSLNISGTSGPHPNRLRGAFEIVTPPPALEIQQDTLFLVEQGLSAAYVPFLICNANLCLGETDFEYVITSLGHIGLGISQGSTIGVSGGKCGDVFGIIDAGDAEVCDYDTLTIMAWNTTEEDEYDTCVIVVHVVEPSAVPLFTAPVVTILVLAMILAAAVIMKRHAISKA